MTKHINIASLRLYDYEHSSLFTGGMERWIRDIAFLLRDKGYDVTVYQKDICNFEKNLTDGVKVKGIKCPANWLGNRTFSKWLENNTNTRDPFVYVSMELALSQRIRRAVGVQHGVFWEGDFPYYKKWLNRILQKQLIKKLNGIICVDTIYINWCHAEYSNRASWEHKLAYIPNYADPELFCVMSEPATIDNLPTILFPRRATGTRYPGKYSMLERSSRGAGLFLKALEVLERENLQVRAIFAGRGPVQNDIVEWARKHVMVDRISVTEVSLDKMPNLYSQANVAVVPSLEREGTSLSAIESIMCGVPTVVSHIGGLGNIVIDGLNGFICDLTPESLANAIKRALAVRRLPTGQTLELFRKNLGKPRWEHQVFSHLSKWLHL